MACGRRIGIVGVGHVGAHVANALLMQGLADELVLCDVDAPKLAGEVQDLLDAMSLYPTNCSIEGAGDEYERLAGCDVVVNAAGDVSASQRDRDGELSVTTDIVRTFAGRVAEAGFAGVWVTVSNPCDVVATELWALTGCDPRRVVGTGAGLDSCRLRHAVADRCGIDQRSVEADMLGEHGFSQFAAWSQARVGGRPLAELAVELPGRFGFDLAEAEEAARRGGYVTMAGKHCTEYAIALATARLVRAVTSDEHLVVPCSTLLTGELGERGHYASLPCVVGASGVEAVLAPRLDDAEREAFAASCAHIRGNLARVGWLEEARLAACRRAGIEPAV